MKTIIQFALLAFAAGLSAGSPAAAATPADPPMPKTVIYDHCSWDHPGVNPFMGDVVAAVDRYRDIAPDVRERLKARMAKREYDDLVSIRRDRIDGRAGYDYGSTISEMHFGTHQLCHSVTRSAWTAAMEERGLVYCDSGQCILVPTVCRNVSRIGRRGVGDEAAALAPLLPAAPVAEALAPIDWFGPAAAGVPAGIGAPLDGTVGGLPAGDVAMAAPALDGSFFGAGPGAVPGGCFGGFGGFAGVGGFAGFGAAMGAGFVAAPLLGPIMGFGGYVDPAFNASSAAVVPEPQAWASLLLGLAALAVALRRPARHPFTRPTRI